MTLAHSGKAVAMTGHSDKAGAKKISYTYQLKKRMDTWSG
jgi:hypothetical protein